MKLFSRFIGEAAVSKAGEQARKLNLKSDGHGGWLDSKGEFVAKTEGSKLKFYNQRQRVGQDPPQPKGINTPIATQGKPAAAQQPVPQRKPKAEAGKSDLHKTLDTLTLAFGRFNPPTIGHAKLIDAAEKASAGGEIKIYPSRTVDNSKNPIPPDMKVSYMRKMFPDYEEQIINDPEMRTIFNVLIAADEEGYKSVNIVAGADRIAEFEKIAVEYNGSEYFDFPDGINTITVEREEGGEGVLGTSATKQRQAVLDDDIETFRKGLPKDFDEADTQALFDAVRQGLSVKKKGKKGEEVEEQSDPWMVAPKLYPKELRENYFKKKIFNVGDLVENLNTGLVGEIIRRGTNYLIWVTEQNHMFKSWTYDLMEYTEKRMERKMRDKTHPNMLVGTGGARKNVQAKVSNAKIMNFNIEEFINKYKLRK